MTIYKFGSAHNLLPWPALPCPSLTCANPTKRKHAQPRALSWLVNVGPTNWKTSKKMNEFVKHFVNEWIQYRTLPIWVRNVPSKYSFFENRFLQKNNHVSVPCSSSEVFHQPIMPFGLAIINHPMLRLEGWLLQFLLNTVYKKHLLIWDHKSSVWVWDLHLNGQPSPPYKMGPLTSSMGSWDSQTAQGAPLHPRDEPFQGRTVLGPLPWRCIFFCGVLVIYTKKCSITLQYYLQKLLWIRWNPGDFKRVYHDTMWKICRSGTWWTSGDLWWSPIWGKTLPSAKKQLVIFLNPIPLTWLRHFVSI